MLDNDQIARLEHSDKLHVWHPFTQMKDYVAEQPLIIEEGEGAVLRDVRGNEYLDGVSSIWCNVHGHRRPEIDEAIRTQLGKIAHSTMLGLANVPATELAERLVSITPVGLEKVFYSDSGSEAVEIALKMAFQFWQQGRRASKRKQKFLVLENAYHGDTIGAVSVGAIELFHSIYQPLLFETYQAPSPYCYRCSLSLERERCGFACLAELGKILERHADEIAGVVLEPLVQGAGGMLVAPEGYLRGVRDCCNRHDALLIADEVAVGFGRTGRMFACEHEAVVPDLMAIAKGLTGGYLPLAATLATDEVYEAFLGEYRELKTFFHGHTYTGNPLACAAALACLDIFDKDDVLDALQPKIQFLTERLEVMEALAHVGDVRQRGFMAGLELVQDRATKEPYPLDEKIGIKVTMAARREGLIIRPLGNVIVIMPPFCITDEQLARMLDTIEGAIRTVTENQ